MTIYSKINSQYSLKEIKEPLIIHQNINIIQKNI